VKQEGRGDIVWQMAESRPGGRTAAHRRRGSSAPSCSGRPSRNWARSLGRRNEINSRLEFLNSSRSSMAQGRQGRTKRVVVLRPFLTAPRVSLVLEVRIDLAVEPRVAPVGQIAERSSRGGPLTSPHTSFHQSRLRGRWGDRASRRKGGSPRGPHPAGFSSARGNGASGTAAHGSGRCGCSFLRAWAATDGTRACTRIPSLRAARVSAERWLRRCW